MTIIHELASPKRKQDFFRRHPSKLYKYRFWEDPFHKKIVTDNELFFSSPSKFNDPFDCGLPFNQHPENWDPLLIKSKVEEIFPSLFPDLVKQPAKMEEACARQVMLIQQNPKSWFELNWGLYPENLSKLFGVLSLAPCPDNYLMWSHYSQSHKGFCVEFDTRKLVESVKAHFMKVVYSDEIPLLSIRDTIDQELINKLIYTKAKHWAYEDEYRLTLLQQPDKAVKFNPEALTAVYFGCKTPYEHQIDIIENVKKIYPWVKFFNLNLSSERFKLVKGDIKLF